MPSPPSPSPLTHTHTHTHTHRSDTRAPPCQAGRPLLVGDRAAVLQVGDRLAAPAAAVASLAVVDPAAVRKLVRAYGEFFDHISLRKGWRTVPFGLADVSR